MRIVRRARPRDSTPWRRSSARCASRQASGFATDNTGRRATLARLAADGLSSREIAARLYLSARTVENHLQRSYEKLGIKGRDELAAALGAP